MSSFQSYSTFSSENLSVSDGEEGNTSEHSRSGPLEALSASQEEQLDELLSHTPEIPIDISTQSDGLSDKECAVRRVKTQISLGKLCADEHSYEVSTSAPLFPLDTRFLSGIDKEKVNDQGLHSQQQTYVQSQHAQAS